MAESNKNLRSQLEQRRKVEEELQQRCSQFEQRIEQQTADLEAAKSQIEVLEENESADANAFVYDMLKNCVKRSASDVHIDLALSKILIW